MESSRRTNNLIACVLIVCVCICLSVLLGLAIANIVFIERIDDRLGGTDDDDGVVQLPQGAAVDNFNKRNVFGDPHKANRLVLNAKKSPGDAALSAVKLMGNRPAASANKVFGGVKSVNTNHAKAQAVNRGKKTGGADVSQSTIALALELAHSVHDVATKAKKSTKLVVRNLGEQLSTDEAALIAILKVLKKALLAQNRKESLNDIKTLHNIASSLTHTLNSLKTANTDKHVDMALIASASTKATGVFDSSSRLLQAL